MKNVEPMHQDTGFDQRAVIIATGIRSILWRLVITWSEGPILTAGVVKKCDVGEESAQNGLRGKICGLPVRPFRKWQRGGFDLAMCGFSPQAKGSRLLMHPIRESIVHRALLA